MSSNSSPFLALRPSMPPIAALVYVARLPIIMLPPTPPAKAIYPLLPHFAGPRAITLPALAAYARLSSMLCPLSVAPMSAPVTANTQSVSISIVGPKSVASIALWFISLPTNAFARLNAYVSIAPAVGMPSD